MSGESFERASGEPSGARLERASGKQAFGGFGRGLVFAALAAAGWPVFALLAGPLLGLPAALACYGVTALAAHVWAIAPRRGGGLLAAGAMLGLGSGAAALAAGPGELAVAGAALLGALRSGWLYRARSARALLTEAVLLGGGLALARFLAVPGLLGPALALWGFFLVQSLFFVLGGVAPRRPACGELDPFELARTRLGALLEEE